MDTDTVPTVELATLPDDPAVLKQVVVQLLEELVCLASLLFHL